MEHKIVLRTPPVITEIETIELNGKIFVVEDSPLLIKKLTLIMDAGDPPRLVIEYFDEVLEGEYPDTCPKK